MAEPWAETAPSSPPVSRDDVRLRFAPAPTGTLHLGSARAALFNWLYARRTGGELLLRIEDTNAELNRPELIDGIIECLAWLGIDFDAEPVRQSERRPLYDAAIDRWLDEGHAYHDDGAVRFRVPDDGVTAWDDLVRGRVEWRNEHIEDFVVRRSDGSPTFFVANAVDDLDMGITHVARGEDLINVTPNVLLLRAALGQPQPPVFAHLPLLVGADGKKLSKRRDDVSVDSYRRQGILAPAMANFLALLGWGPPDGVEIRPICEIAALFDFASVNASPARCDAAKLEAINGQYLRALPAAEFAAAATPYLRAAPWGSRLAADDIARLAPLVQERSRKLADVPGRVEFVFADVVIDDETWAKVAAAPHSAAILRDALEQFAEVSWEADALHGALRDIGERHGLRLGKAQAPVRAAITGAAVGPPLFDSLELMERAVVLARLSAAADRLEAHRAETETTAVGVCTDADADADAAAADAAADGVSRPTG